MRREPAQLSDATVQPVLFTILFVYIFGAAMTIPGGSYKDFAIGGLVTMNLTTASMGTAVGLSSDLSHRGDQPLPHAADAAQRDPRRPHARPTCWPSVLCGTIVLSPATSIGWRPGNGRSSA